LAVYKPSKHTTNSPAFLRRSEPTANFTKKELLRRETKKMKETQKNTSKERMNERKKESNKHRMKETKKERNEET
jgi:hypothetical protein